VLYLEKRQFA